MYIDDFKALEGGLPGRTGENIEYDGMRISRFQFRSGRAHPLPELSDTPLGALRDSDIEENRCFPYYTFQPARGAPSRGVIILLHGLNEKSWDKYLPWAAQLCRNSGKTVLLFPIAFHMDRAPADWSSPRKMQALAKSRQARYNAGAASFVNAALSTRLHAAPERFFLSGLEAYADVIELVRLIRKGRIKGINPSDRIDFFGYSIGAFLTEIIMLTDPEGLFSQSRAVLFCGGTTLDLMRPVSKYILDSTAAEAVTSYFTGRFPSVIRRSAGMAEIFQTFHEESRTFTGMALDDIGRDERNSRLKRVSGRLKAILLKQDGVMPAEAVRKTLEEGRRATGTILRVLDFPFPYDHVQPFPPIVDIAGKVDTAFRTVFSLTSEALS